MEMTSVVGAMISLIQPQISILAPWFIGDINKGKASNFVSNLKGI